eukprot:6072703-Heterocapsa_arctica.AAC.1
MGGLVAIRSGCGLWHQGYRHVRAVHIGTEMSVVQVVRTLITGDKLHVVGHKGLAIVVRDDDVALSG